VLVVKRANLAPERKQAELEQVHLAHFLGKKRARFLLLLLLLFAVLGFELRASCMPWLFTA
jgi:hypothetical protein